jgi:hypothetical protein
MPRFVRGKRVSATRRRPKSKKEIMKKRLIVITALCLALGTSFGRMSALPPGAKIAVLEGDPGKEGYYAIRVKYPEGLYKIAPHTHPQTEHLTVISGE